MCKMLYKVSISLVISYYANFNLKKLINLDLKLNLLNYIK